MPRNNTVYSRRLRSAQREQVCRCKVGSCSICGSKCRRCMCSCDGIEPSDALSRSRGGYRRQANAIKRQRQTAADVSVKNILKENKKRKRNSHFQKVGYIRDSISAKQAYRSKPRKKSDDSDSDYVDGADETTVTEENSTVAPSVHNEQEKNSTKTSINVSSKSRDDNDITTTEFDLEIDTNVSSIPDDIFGEKEMTIADRIMTARGDARSTKYEILKRKKRRSSVLGAKRKTRDELVEEVNDDLRLNHVPTRTNNLEELLKNLDIPNHWIRLIPSFRIRETSTNIKEAASMSSFARLVSLAKKMILSSLKSLCPGPGYEEFHSHVLSGLFNKKEMSEQQHSIEQQINTKDATSSKNLYKRTTSEKLGSVIGTLCAWSNKSRKGSIERRVIRAIINESFLKHEVREMKDDEKYKLKQGNGQPVDQARSDADLLRNGNNLSKTLITRQKKNHNTVEKCVDFILSDANVSSVSWGSKVVLSQSIGHVTLPKLTRKTPIHHMYVKYKELTKDDDDRLKSTSFYNICNILSTNDDAMLSSIDYVSGLLVNETCETLQEIVERLIPTEFQTECTKFISIAKNFMKNQYKDRIMMDDNCCFHGLKYALSHDMPQRDDTNDDACKFPFFVCDHLKTLVSNNASSTDNNHPENDEIDNNEPTSNYDDAINVIDDISEKFKLFLAHQARCKCQLVAISTAEEQIKEKTISSNGKNIEAIIIMDFKMKYAMKSTRETTIEHFGKRGIGWHGFAVVYYQLDHEGNAIRNIVYIDQILNDTNKQDGTTVVGLLEVAITAITSELPFIKNAIVTSDNATCYQNHFVTFMMSIFNKKFAGKFFISAFMHTETQDGKSLLDAHFATSNRHLLFFMKTWRSNRVTRINTARGLAYALSFNLGLKNSMVQLVEIDRERLEGIKKVFDKLITKCGEYYNRTNHITFDARSIEQGWSQNSNNQDEFTNMIKNCSFSFAVMAYSHVTTPVQFYVNVKEQQLTVDEDTQNRIDAILENDGNGAPEDIAPKDDTVNEEESIADSSVPVAEVVMNEDEDKDEGSDFSTFRKSKRDFMEKLEVIGAFSLLGISPDDMKATKEKRMNDDESDSDSDYDDDASDASNTSDNDNLDSFFLSKNEQQTYAEAPSHLFGAHLMISGANVLRWLPLGAIRSKKASTNKHKNISSKSMLKGLSDVAVVYAKNNIAQNNLFQSRHAVDPVVVKATDYKMQPFENGWAKRKAHGHTYGHSYLHLYENELIQMYQQGVRNSSAKMSAGKMRENLLSMYPDRFSIPGETEIKQFIGKLTQTNKNYDPVKQKSTRGRKAGNGKRSWHASLQDLIDKDPSEKPEIIYRSLIENFGDTLPDDFPKTEENEPDKKKIKSTIARFKVNIKKNAMRSIII